MNTGPSAQVPTAGARLLAANLLLLPPMVVAPRAWRHVGAALLAGAATLGSTSRAAAQLEPLDDGLSVGEWTFRPSVELRVRGLYRHGSADTGGDTYGSTALLGDGFQSSVPAVAVRHPAVDDQWLLSERARLGLQVDWRMVSARVEVQDSRVLGLLPTSPNEVPAGGSGRFAPSEAWLQIHTADGDPAVQVRLGRQRVKWGDGRLLSDSEWSPHGAQLDAGRVDMRFGDFDLHMLGALLQAPGELPPTHTTRAFQLAAADDGSAENGPGTGAQLYGLMAAYHVRTWLVFEATGLARIVRLPAPPTLTPGDTFVVGGRIHGDERGVSYAVEGAYEFGRVASFGVNRDLSAFAVAGRVAWETALPGHLRFSAFGSYASGATDNGDPNATLTRFDPILPDVHEHHGLMDLYAWSNLIEGGANVSARPSDEVAVALGFELPALAEPGDRWTTEALQVVGAAPGNTSRILGYEVDAQIDVRPWDMVAFSGGYGLFIMAEGGRNVFAAAGRSDADLIHFAFLQAEVKAP